MKSPKNLEGSHNRYYSLKQKDGSANNLDTEFIQKLIIKHATIHPLRNRKKWILAQWKSTT